MPTPEPHPEDLLTATELCKALKISRRTFQRLREDGRLPKPTIETSRTTMRWRRGDVVAALSKDMPRGSIAERLRVASTHARAAAMNARAAAVHADAAAALVGQLAAKAQQNQPASAIAEAPPKPTGWKAAAADQLGDAALAHPPQE